MEYGAYLSTSFRGGAVSGLVELDRTTPLVLISWGPSAEERRIMGVPAEVALGFLECPRLPCESRMGVDAVGREVGFTPPFFL